MMAQFIATQSKTNETLTAAINQLTSQFDAMATHQKAMDTQIAKLLSRLAICHDLRGIYQVNLRPTLEAI